MAPVSDRIYFPSLEDCLKGDTILLPWKLVATALASEAVTLSRSETLIQFLQDDYVRSLLRNPSTAFAPPNDSTKSEFETKTAAIHVTPNSAGAYDIQTIKSDAAWLSKGANINLVAALRLVVLEFQARPASHLAGPLSTQDAVNLQEAAGVNNGSMSSLLPLSGVTMDADAIWREFEQDGARRLRIFRTYLAERRYLSMAADLAQAESLTLQKKKITAGDKISDALYPVLPEEDSSKQAEGVIDANLKLLAKTVKDLAEGYERAVDDSSLRSEELELDWQRTLITEIVHSLSLIFHALHMHGEFFAPPETVMEWFTLMEDYMFLDGISSAHEFINVLIAPLQTLVCAISLKLLNPTRSMAFLAQDLELNGEENNPYLTATDVLAKVHEAIMAAADAGCESQIPVIFVWTVLAHRMKVSHNERSEKRDTLQNQRAQETFESGAMLRPTTGRRMSAGSIVSLDGLPFDGFLAIAGLKDDMQVIEQLAQVVTSQGRVYDVVSGMMNATAAPEEGSFTPRLTSQLRLIFVDFLKATFPLVGYQSDPVSALLSVLSTGRGYWDLSTATVEPSFDIASRLVSDQEAMGYYFHQAFSRFPYEFLPLINLCRSLISTSAVGETADVILDMLRKTPTITFALPADFQEYELAQEEDNTNTFRILQDIPLFTPASSWARRSHEDESLQIPAGTYGRFISDTGRVALMEHQHSLIGLLGKRLEVHQSPESYRGVFENLGTEDVAEVVSLLATVLRAETLKAERRGKRGDESLKVGLEILEETSKHISGNEDIISVVTNLLDVYMQDDQTTADGPGIMVLNACVQFLHAVLPLCPTRVWSYMARCDLLNSDARAGKLTRIVGNLDLTPDRFDFLLSTIRLFYSLVDSVMKSVVQRRAGNKLNGRQKSTSNVWVGVADRILSRVSVAIAQALVDVFESSSTWRFPSAFQQTLLIRHLVPVMDSLVKDAYSIGDATSQDALTAALRPAADYIIESFQSASQGSLRFQALLSTWITALDIPDLTLYYSKLGTMRQQVVATVGFATNLLRVASLLSRPAAGFESYLFKAASLFARLSAVDEQFKRPAMSLLGALVVSAAATHDDPPSLLGYLGPLPSRSFLHLLSRLGKPLNQPLEVAATWQFFSIIVQNRQQWMSNCLLTGKTPRDALKEESKSPELPTSVLNTAFTKLKKISELDPAEALRILEFVNSAQNHWPWTIFTMQKDSSYVDSLKGFVKNLRSASSTARSDAVKAAIEAKMAAYVAEIFAMQLYHQRQMGNSGELAKSLISNLDYYLRDGVEIASYNNSLHRNFDKNFSAKYPGLSPDSLKRTSLEPGDLGKNFYFALDRANEMFEFDPGWHGKRDDGFRKEMEIANANLSLVDAQISLFRGWELLLLELSSSLAKDGTVQRQMLQVAQQCLSANESTQGPEKIFIRIVEQRGTLALMLLRRLVGQIHTANDINQLLGSLFSVLHNIREPFGAETIERYRTILRTIYVCLRLYGTGDKKGFGESTTGTGLSATTLTQTILNLLDDVVAKGFRTMVTLIHDSEAAVAPEDLALLTAILQACLGMPGMDQCQTQVLNIMGAYDVIHAATSLFSWADRLTVDGDPIYGELSILFLLELSTLPRVAEEMATNGILSQLTSANITNFMRKPIISPFSDIAGAQRCYSIWAKGILPLLLNLLTALSGTVAPEIAYVLNQFPHLLKSSVERFEAPGASRTASRDTPHYVTLLAVSEVHTLSLLVKVIRALRVNNTRDIPEIAWDAGALLENVEFWLSTRRLLKERLLPLGQREVEWRGAALGASDDGGGPDNVLEAKVVAQLEAVRDILGDDLE